VLGVVAFFGKTLAICFIQAFIRWSLPRFRYDQLMKLGWRVLLPASLANILVTGVVILLLKELSPQGAKVVQLVADVSQGLVAGLLGYGGVRLLLWSFGSRTVNLGDVMGSTASISKAQGGTQESSMQA
jgi:NADH-quinone oxidoreductase subunit H